MNQDLNLGMLLFLLCITLATCTMYNQQNPVKLPDAPTPETGPVASTTVTSTATQGVPGTAVLPLGSERLALSPAETLAKARLHPVRPAIRWERMDNGGEIIASAPWGAMLYRDGALQRPVYWDPEECAPWLVGKMRLTRYCGHPASEIEITFSDERVERVTVPVVPCMGY